MTHIDADPHIEAIHPRSESEGDGNPFFFMQLAIANLLELSIPLYCAHILSRTSFFFPQFPIVVGARPLESPQVIGMFLAYPYAHSSGHSGSTVSQLPRVVRNGLARTYNRDEVSV